MKLAGGSPRLQRSHMVTQAVLADRDCERRWAVFRVRIVFFQRDGIKRGAKLERGWGRDRLAGAVPAFGGTGILPRSEREHGDQSAHGM